MEKKLGNIWQLMNVFNFKFDHKLSAELICVLCKKILIDARLSWCGCRFCKKCIEQYLATDDLICPGNSDECGEEMLNMERNISIDHFVNRKIAKIKVQCPIETCPFMDQMMNMEEHLNICRKDAVKCPYSEHGCNYACLEEENISSHLNTNKDGHIEMIVVTIEGMQNQLEEVSNENNSIKEAAEMTKGLMDDLRTQLEEKDKSISAMTNEVCQLAQLRKQLEEKDQSISSIRNEMTSKCGSHLEEVNSLKYDLNAFCEENATEFEWEIITFAHIKKTATKSYSDEFAIHPNGTKLQLYCQYDENGQVFDITADMTYRGTDINKNWSVTCDLTIGIWNPTAEKYFISKKHNLKFTDSNPSSAPFRFTKPNLLTIYLLQKRITVKCTVTITY